MPRPKRTPILNPDKDYSAAHAFDSNRVAPRPIYDPPFGEHPDDDRFIVVDGVGGDPPEATQKTAGVVLRARRDYES